MENFNRTSVNCDLNQVLVFDWRGDFIRHITVIILEKIATNYTVWLHVLLITIRREDQGLSSQYI